jgi:hypothetical protein
VLLSRGKPFTLVTKIGTVVPTHPYLKLQFIVDIFCLYSSLPRALSLSSEVYVTSRCKEANKVPNAPTFMFWNSFEIMAQLVESYSYIKNQLLLLGDVLLMNAS